MKSDIARPDPLINDPLIKNSEIYIYFLFKYFLEI
jgi:hypothetical protein